MSKLGVEEWIVKLVQGMYEKVRSRVRVGEGVSDEFEVKVGVHQGSVLSPLLIIIALELCHDSFELVYLGRTFMPITLSLLLTTRKNVSVYCWLGRRAMGRRAESERGEDQDNDWWYRP